MTWWLIWLGASAPACGRIDFDESTAIPLGPFASPTKISELSTTFAEDDPTLTGDELEIYFDSDRPGGTGSDDIWRATRATRTSAWNAPTSVAELSSIDSDVSPGVSIDGLTIFMTRPGSGTGTGYDIYSATRPDRMSSWSAPVRVDELSASDEDTNAQLAADGLSIWFSSTRGGATKRQIWFATRDTRTAPWNAPTMIDALDIAPGTYTGDPDPNATDTRLYFITDRAGVKNIWVADRPTPMTFGLPHPIEELASPNVQTDPWDSVDEQRLYYAQRGPTLDLFVAARQPLSTRAQTSGRQGDVNQQ